MRHFFSSRHILIPIFLLMVSTVPVTVFSQDLPPESDTATQSKSPPPEIYVDQVIDEESLAREIEAEKKRDRVIAPQWGPGSLGMTYRYYNNELDNRIDLTEHGIELRWRQETFENGSFEIQVDGLTAEGYEYRNPNGRRILFRQQNFTLNRGLQLDSEIINYRSINPKLITESYRIRLPSTILQGMGNIIYDDNTSIYLNFGEIGTYEGTAARVYKPTQGSMQGMGAQHHLDKNWDFGFQIWNTSETEQVESHQSLAGAIQYQQLSQNHQFHFLGDSQGKTGAWYDGSFQVGRWSHRAGTVYLPPDLLWTDAPITNDRAGIYWRGDRQSFRWHWNLGSEISKNNLDNDPDLAGYASTSSFVNMSWQFRRKTQLGGNINLQTDNADSGRADENKYRTLIKGFVTQQFPIGRTRLQSQAEIRQSQSEDYKRYGLLWDQDWNNRFINRFNTDVEYYLADNGDDEFNFRIYLEKNFLSDLRLTGSVQQVISRDVDLGDSYATSVSLGVGWQFLRNWVMSLDADYNRNMFDPDEVDIAESNIDGTRVLFSISYALNTGRPRSLYGVDTGNPGRGRIVGNVFLDENKNGKFDLGEKPLRDIVINLDGRFTTESRLKGGFEFWPVASGEHVLNISMDDVPLPWGRLEESPVRVVVPIRGEVQIDFALIRMNE